MIENVELARQFEHHRGRLRAIARRILGSEAEADDAVQETWLRLSRSDTGDVRNLAAWLTTVVGRICLDLLRSRTARREDPLDVRLPDPVVTRLDADPESAAEQADEVTLALLVVLDALGPRERTAFVLHDLFGVPFEQVGQIVGASAATATQLASRARRRVRAAAPPVADRATQRRVLDAFSDAAQRGDFEALLELLDPDATLRADAGPSGRSVLVRGAAEIASRASSFRRAGLEQVHVLVNGAVGLLATRDGRPVSLFTPVVRDGRIVEIDILADPDRLARLV